MRARRGFVMGQFLGPHSITVDQERNLYLAEVFNGQEVGYSASSN